ncbi:MAG: patatin family protein [Bacteroidales bacterium]|nr:patatin family protein [Candidatus Physcocola equi]
MKKGLVLEGGAMRGMFTAGVLDVLMEAGITFDGGIGVSAGAAFGVNYKSKQIGRALRYNQKMAKEWKYCSIRSLLLTGDLFGADFCYHYVPRHIDIFDVETFQKDPMKFYLVCSNVETGEAVYHELTTGDDTELEWIRASASMPVCSRVVEIDGMKLLDGGMTDSIPLEKMQSLGYEKNLVILTQPAGFVKQPTSFMPLMRLGLHKYPKIADALGNRHIMYNKQLEHLQTAIAQGKTMAIYPPHKLPIGHLCHDPEQMAKVHQIGRETAKAKLNEIKAFLEVD